MNKVEGPTYEPTSASALEYARAGLLEDWIHLFLRGEGNNIPFSDGLRLEPRRYHPPALLELSALERCCGPEEGMAFQIPAEGFEDRVAAIAARMESGWDMPPLIVNLTPQGMTLSDGNHRFEALKRLGAERHWAILWETVVEGPAQ